MLELDLDRFKWIDDTPGHEVGAEALARWRHPELGRSPEVAVVAAGVETGVKHDRVATHGWELAQGFHLGRPMKLKRLCALL